MTYEMDHVAIPSLNIAASVAWYQERFGAKILYQDSTWAFLQLGQGKLALVTPTQHPFHVGLRVTQEQLTAAAAEAGLPIDKHRDGTQGIYIADPDGNQVELINYPA